ncbi:MAG: hypothetical protein V4793_02030 [Paraburkholderia tropica]|uniref:hypothetical protein n=1 Tax=Paraburkholderia tropica TaxID=92647 RepID=UPI001617A004|nr:hypothetical protein [Paraburkholderia tropica]MBB2984762.1 hypothetical protein [Paraburkholderia tropica]
MTPDEFDRVVRTWGSRPDRWPAASRDDALRFADSLDRAQRRNLDEERLLDALLDTLENAQPSPELCSRIMATIPAGRASVVQRHPWWSGLGLVGAATIGVAAGILFMSLLLSPVSHRFPVPGAPDGAVSFRMDAFAVPAPDMETD